MNLLSLVTYGSRGGNEDVMHYPRSLEVVLADDEEPVLQVPDDPCTVCALHHFLCQLARVVDPLPNFVEEAIQDKIPPLFGKCGGLC